MLTHATALRSAEPYLIRHADRWCELLLLGTEAGWSEAKNMANWANYLVFDILGDLCYARSFGIKEPGPNELKFIPELISDYLKFMNPVSGLSLDYYFPSSLAIYIVKPFFGLVLDERLDGATK